jgi:hypothetical protein
VLPWLLSKLKSSLVLQTITAGGATTSKSNQLRTLFQNSFVGSIRIRDLVDLVEELQRRGKQAARELIVLELYRLGEVSSGRAAQLLSMDE